MLHRILCHLRVLGFSNYKIKTTPKEKKRSQETRDIKEGRQVRNNFMCTMSSPSVCGTQLSSAAPPFLYINYCDGQGDLMVLFLILPREGINNNNAHPLRAQSAGRASQGDELVRCCGEMCLYARSLRYDRELCRRDGAGRRGGCSREWRRRRKIKRRRKGEGRG